jgi:AbrB family looped-hinge helix DNA binding protein
MGNKMIDVSHVSSRGTSVRVTIPKKVVKLLNLKDGDIVVFKEHKDGFIVIDKLKGD